MATPLDRGIAFELQLHALFEAHGYRALHDVRLAGRSGAEHQVDVYAELVTPLQVIRVIVEAKAHEQPVDKDALLKLQQIVDDLGADRGVLATTSGFTSGALLMAEGRNVDLWDRDRVSRLLGEVALAGVAGGVAAGTAVGIGAPGLLAVAPRFSLEEVRAAVEDEVARGRKGGFLGVGKVEEQVGEVTLEHRPFYELDVDAVVYIEERRGLRARGQVRTIVPLRISIDAHTGALVTVAANGHIAETGHELPDLGEDECAAVKALRDTDFSKDDLLARGWRPAKAQQLLASLVAKGIVESVEDVHGRYRVTGLVPVEAGFRAVSVAFAAEPLAIEPRMIHGAALSQAAVVRSVEALVPEAQVRSLSVVYVPVFAADLERPDGVRRRELIDGITGEPLGR